MSDLLGTATFPTFETPVQNSLGVIRFSGTSNPLTSEGNFTFRHLFIVAKYSGATFTGAPGLLTNTAGTIGLFGVNGLTRFASIASMGSATWAAYVNGVAQDVTQIAAPMNAFSLVELHASVDVSMVGLVVGRKGTAGDKFTGDVAEIYGADATLQTDLREIRENLLNKWGI
jgi:hypothetical protein